MKALRYCLILGLASLLGLPSHADVRMIPLFGDHMVLQQEAKVPVWGMADAGEKVTVTVGDHKASTTAGTDGTWRVELAPFPSGAAPTTMTVAGKNTLTFQDVLVGDVWVCSGQSNMEFNLGGEATRATAIPAANDPQLRLFVVTKKLSLQPLTDLDGKWELCTPDSAKGFSAVGYFFGKALRADLNRPIGLIGTYWGGSTAQCWTSLSGLQKDPPFTRYLDVYKTNVANFDKLNDHYAEREAAYTADLKTWTDAGNKTAFDAWNIEMRKALAAHQPVPPQTFPPKPKEPPLPGGDQRAPTNLFNGMVNPLLSYAIKGVIWYQGEYNTDDPLEYYDLLPRLITDWREKWGQGNFPFLIVQLPSLFVYNDPGSPRSINSDNWDVVREAQEKTLSLPNTGMVVTLDIGGRLHPTDKLDVGERLALLARHDVYGEKIVDSGPIYQSMTKDGNKITIKFDQVNGGLTIGQSPSPETIGSRAFQPTDKLIGFAIAGADKQWVEADAQIVGTTVVVSSPQVSDPVAVRYGWGSGRFDAECNFYNKDGLPAAPFRTDDWDDIHAANAKLPPSMSPTPAAPTPATGSTH
jgi:sialate O-acetylesterase